jgi:hypothetical protein
VWYGDNFHEGHMEGLVTCLGGDIVWRRIVGPFRIIELSLRKHGITWFLTWRLVLDMRMLGLRSIH